MHPTTSLERDDLLLYDVLHQALRFQLRAFERTVTELVQGADQSLDGDRRDGVAELRRWLDQVRDVVRHHHRIQDDRIRPLLADADADAGAGAIDRTVDPDRCAVADAFAVADRALDHLGTDPGRRAEACAEAAAHHLAAALERLVQRERATTLPALLAGVSRRGYQDATRLTAAESDVKLLAFLGPWLLPACSPEQVDRVCARLPRMLRHVTRFVWVPRYEQSFPRLAAAGHRLLTETADRPGCPEVAA